MINAELHVLGGKHSGQVIPLDRKKYLIGREQDCQLRPNSEMVSRHHCVFSIDNYSVRLRDLGSTNGTLVNGDRIVKEVILAEGDHVVVGSLEFEFRVARPSGTESANEETVVGSTDTIMEVSQPQTVSDSAAEFVAMAPQPNQPQPPDSDTTVIHQNMIAPGQQPYQPMMPQAPMMPQQAGYPGQMYPGYPYQPQPQMPMYPQGYPQQMMPGPMPGYPQPATPAAAESAGAAPPSDSADVLLPDPSETGAKEVPKKEPTADASGETKKADDGDSTNAAAAIIKQYTQRRPG